MTPTKASQNPDTLRQLAELLRPFLATQVAEEPPAKVKAPTKKELGGVFALDTENGYAEGGRKRSANLAAKYEATMNALAAAAKGLTKARNAVTTARATHGRNTPEWNEARRKHYAAENKLDKAIAAYQGEAKES